MPANFLVGRFLMQSVYREVIKEIVRGFLMQHVATYVLQAPMQLLSTSVRAHFPNGEQRASMTTCWSSLRHLAGAHFRAACLDVRLVDGHADALDVWP